MISTENMDYEEEMESQITHPVVTIKHGKDPEVQEVDIACRLQNGSLQQDSTSERKEIEIEFVPIKRHKKQKSMTTKSTMTNEDDYTVAAHTNTPCTTPSESMIDNNILDDEANDTIEVAHKIVGWKITPRVHFPPPNTLNASSLRTLDAKDKHLPQKDSKEFSATIDPPYIHRPDRTLVIHQTRPMPLQPVKAWPGYGGNIYFQPFQIDTKPIGDRSYLKTPVPRSSSVSGSRFDRSQTENDIYSISKYSSFYRSSPSLGSLRKSQSRYSPGKNEKRFDHSDAQTQDHKCPNRQIARLDKNYVIGLKTKGTVTEDLTLLSGMDSLGTLKLGNPLSDVKRQSTNETYTRQTIVEKVPRNFIFHSSVDQKLHEKLVQPKIDEKIKSLTIRRYLKSYGIPEWALKQFVEKYYRDNRGRLRLPNIPLRVKGQKAHVFGSSR